MTNLWAKLYDTDRNGNLEAVQLSDDDPSTLFTPEACQYWHAVPEGTAMGDVLEKETGTWWKGADWLDKVIAESPPPGEDAPAVPNIFEGGVLAVEIVAAGSNYIESSVRDQYDIEESQGLVLEVMFDPKTEGAVSTVIHNPGKNYQVGQTFNIHHGRDLQTWDRRNPTWCTIRITEIKT